MMKTTKADKGKLMRRTFKKHVNFHFVVWKSGKVELCASLLLDFVAIPSDIKRIDVVFYERPGKNRIKVTLPDEKYDNVMVDGESIMLYPSTDYFLFHHFKKNQTVYVGFEY